MERSGREVPWICQSLSEEVVEPGEICIHESLTETHVLWVSGVDEEHSHFETEDVGKYVAQIRWLRHSPQSFDQVLHRQKAYDDGSDDLEREIACHHLFSDTFVKLWFT